MKKYTPLSPSDQELMIMMAFRYALGRRTYVVKFIVDYIIENWDNFNKTTQNKFKDEIKEHEELYGGLGHKCDEKEWNRILYK